MAHQTAQNITVQVLDDALDNVLQLGERILDDALTAPQDGCTRQKVLNSKSIFEAQSQAQNGGGSDGISGAGGVVSEHSLLYRILVAPAVSYRWHLLGVAVAVAWYMVSWWFGVLILFLYAVKRILWVLISTTHEHTRRKFTTVDTSNMTPEQLLQHDDATRRQFASNLGQNIMAKYKSQLEKETAERLNAYIAPIIDQVLKELLSIRIHEVQAVIQRENPSAGELIKTLLKPVLASAIKKYTQDCSIVYRGMLQKVIENRINKKLAALVEVPILKDNIVDDIQASFGPLMPKTTAAFVAYLSPKSTKEGGKDGEEDSGGLGGSMVTNALGNLKALEAVPEVLSEELSEKAVDWIGDLIKLSDQERVSFTEYLKECQAKDRERNKANADKPPENKDEKLKFGEGVQPSPELVAAVSTRLKQTIGREIKEKLDGFGAFKGMVDSISNLMDGVPFHKKKTTKEPEVEERELETKGIVLGGSARTTLPRKSTEEQRRADLEKEIENKTGQDLHLIAGEQFELLEEDLPAVVMILKAILKIANIVSGVAAKTESGDDSDGSGSSGSGSRDTKKSKPKKSKTKRDAKEKKQGGAPGEKEEEEDVLETSTAQLFIWLGAKLLHNKELSLLDKELRDVSEVLEEVIRILEVVLMFVRTLLRVLVAHMPSLTRELVGFVNLTIDEYAEKTLLALSMGFSALNQSRFWDRLFNTALQVMQKSVVEVKMLKNEVNLKKNLVQQNLKQALLRDILVSAVDHVSHRIEFVIEKIRVQWHKSAEMKNTDKDTPGSREKGQKKSSAARSKRVVRLSKLRRSMRKMSSTAPPKPNLPLSPLVAQDASDSPVHSPAGSPARQRSSAPSAVPLLDLSGSLNLSGHLGVAAHNLQGKKRIDDVFDKLSKTSVHLFVKLKKQLGALGSSDMFKDSASSGDIMPEVLSRTVTDMVFAGQNDGKGGAEDDEGADNTDDFSLHSWWKLIRPLLREIVEHIPEGIAEPIQDSIDYILDAVDAQGGEVNTNSFLLSRLAVSADQEEVKFLFFPFAVLDLMEELGKRVRYAASILDAVSRPSPGVRLLVGRMFFYSKDQRQETARDIVRCLENFNCFVNLTGNKVQHIARNFRVLLTYLSERENFHVALHEIVTEVMNNRDKIKQLVTKGNSPKVTPARNPDGSDQETGVFLANVLDVLAGASRPMPTEPVLSPRRHTVSGSHEEALKIRLRQKAKEKDNERMREKEKERERVIARQRRSTMSTSGSTPRSDDSPLKHSPQTPQHAVSGEDEPIVKSPSFDQPEAVTPRKQAVGRDVCSVTPPLWVQKNEEEIKRKQQEQRRAEAKPGLGERFRRSRLFGKKSTPAEQPNASPINAKASPIPAKDEPKVISSSEMEHIDAAMEDRGVNSESTDDRAQAVAVLYELRQNSVTDLVRQWPPPPPAGEVTSWNTFIMYLARICEVEFHVGKDKVFDLLEPLGHACVARSTQAKVAPLKRLGSKILMDFVWSVRPLDLMDAPLTTNIVMDVMSMRKAVIAMNEKMYAQRSCLDHAAGGPMFQMPSSVLITDDDVAQIMQQIPLKLKGVYNFKRYQATHIDPSKRMVHDLRARKKKCSRPGKTWSAEDEAKFVFAKRNYYFLRASYVYLKHDVSERLLQAQRDFKNYTQKGNNAWIFKSLVDRNTPAIKDGIGSSSGSWNKSGSGSHSRPGSGSHSRPGSGSHSKPGSGTYVKPGSGLYSSPTSNSDSHVLGLKILSESMSGAVDEGDDELLDYDGNDFSDDEEEYDSDEDSFDDEEDDDDGVARNLRLNDLSRPRGRPGSIDITRSGRTVRSGRHSVGYAVNFVATK
eukprot:TRINITY_DN12815_c0_g1_i1.p1 TRINITY_DN12815_c0_g1~~TRINITY_DN12815_c0_g1_i1.p1  ORF type:complete len:1818 (-),score=501.64 TRINITY_DN12815_c0_g1_i1:54-5507(-)